MEDNKWYESLVDEMRGLLIEAKTASAWTLICAYHTLGSNVLERRAEFESKGISEDGTCDKVAKSIGINRQYVFDAVRFAKKFPDIRMFPGDKAMTWNKVREQYLWTDEQRDKAKKRNRICPKCGYDFKEGKK